MVVVVPMIWPLLVTSALAAQSPVAKIKDLARDGKYEKAVGQCEKLLVKYPDDRGLPDACADAAWNLVEETDSVALDTFAETWAGTTAGQRAHRTAAALTLEAAGTDEDKLRDVVAKYDGTLPAEEALRRLTHADFVAARDAGDAKSMENFLKLHPDASHAVMAVNILNKRRFEEAAAWDTVEAWRTFLDTWPDHPQAEEATGRLADAAYRDATTPEALLAFGLAWPEHDKALEALEGALPLLIQVEYRDSDLEVAARTLDQLLLEAPEGVEVSVQVADQPVAEVCLDAPEPTWVAGVLRFPFGACAPDSDPVRYVVRATAGPAFLDFELWVHQQRQDPTLDLALRYGPMGQLKAGCPTPNTCSPRALAFGDDGRVLAGVQGPTGDAEVAWWPVPAPETRLEDPVEAAGSWRGPLANIAALSLSPDGSRLAVGYCTEQLKSVYLVDIASDRILGTRDGLCALDLRFAPGGRALAVVAGDGVTIIDGQTAVTRNELTSKLPPQVATWSADGERLAWWAQDDSKGQVTVWSGEATSLSPVAAKELLPRSLALTGDGSRACLLADTRYDCWDPVSGRPLRAADLSALQVETSRPVAMAAEVDLVAVGAPDGVALYDGRTAEQVARLGGVSGEVTALALSSDGTRLAAVDSTGAVTVWAAR